jgi:lysophospholipase L1-like esterase
MRLLVFGASTTQGYWDSQGGYVERLNYYYNNLQMQDWSKEQPKVMNLGVSGDTTANLLARMHNEAKARENEKGIAIALSVGSNNAAVRDGQEQSPGEYIEDLKKLLQIAKSLTSQVLFIGFPAVDESRTTPVAWGDIHFKNDRIKLFEDAAKTVCAEFNVPFVPIFQAMKDEADRGKVLQAHDGLHPNDNGHQLIFELVRPAVDELLK